MEAQEASTNVRVAGALSGVVTLPGAARTVGALRAEAARLAGVDDPACIKLIASGRTLAVGGCQGARGATRTGRGVARRCGSG